MKKLVLLVFISLIPLMIFSQTIIRDNKPTSSNNAFTFSSSGIYTDPMKKFNLSTPGTTITVGSTGGCIYAGIDFGMPGGYLYGLHKSSGTVCELFRMDTINANCVLVSSHNYTGNLAGMSFDPITCVHYILVSGTPAKIYTFSPVGGDLILVAMLSPSYSISSIAINNSGSVYGIDEAGDNFLRINKTTGTCTLLGPLGFNANNVSGSDFDPLTGRMYIISQGTSNQELRYIDTAAGGATLVGSFTGIYKHIAVAGNTFTVPALPAIPTLIYPLGGIHTLTPLMDWSDVQKAPLYNIQVTSGPVNVIATFTAQSNYQVPPGILSYNTTYYWRGRAYNGSGYGEWSPYSTFTCTVVGIEQISGEVPKEFRLYDNFPNPFNPSTTIKFDIPKSSAVRLSVYDITGREIETLVNGRLAAGTYETKWDGARYTSGVYFCILTANNERLAIRRMVLIK